MAKHPLARALLVMGALLYPVTFVAPAQVALLVTWVGIYCFVGGFLLLLLGSTSPGPTSRYA